MVIDNTSSVYRLGLLYGFYRIIVVVSLILIFVLNFSAFYKIQLSGSFYINFLLVYLITCLMQFLGYASSVALRRNQYVFYFGLLDVFCFSFLNFFVDSSGHYIGLLFVVTIFVVNIVSSVSQAYILTLLAVIAVVYLPFVDYFGDLNINANFFGSFILAIIFAAVHVFSRLMVRQFRELSEVNQAQFYRLAQINEVNNHILEKIDMGCLVLDEQLRPVIMNPTAAALLGVPHDNYHLLQQKRFSLFVALSKAASLAEMKHAFDFSDGDLDLQITTQKIQLQETWFLVTFEDASRLNERIHALKLASLGQLSASIAHEIRNPLSTIVQANDLIMGSPEPQVGMLVDMIATQATRIDQIIRSVLDMARNKKHVPAATPLKKLLTDIAESDLTDISSSIRIDVSDDLIVWFDEIHLRQVLINLIKNAYRHNNSDASSFIKVSASSNNTEIQVDVIDYGTGVEHSRIQNLFLPFYSTSVDGTGLGLYLSKNLCEANHGKLSYVKLPSGACFRITCKKFTSKN